MFAKSRKNNRVLAIGDGHNDTPMLNAADCAIRIDSRESSENNVGTSEDKADFVVKNFT